MVNQKCLLATNPMTEPVPETSEFADIPEHSTCFNHFCLTFGLEFWARDSVIHDPLRTLDATLQSPSSSMN